MEQRLDFKATVETLTSLSIKAQCTFLYLLISVLSPMVLRTIMRYCCRRLDQINKELPDTHPYKQQYLSRGQRKQDWRNLHVMPQSLAVRLAEFTSNPDLEPYKHEEVDRW